MVSPPFASVQKIAPPNSLLHCRISVASGAEFMSVTAQGRLVSINSSARPEHLSYPTALLGRRPRSRARRVPLSGYRRGDVASSVVTPAPDASGGRSREDNMRILSAVCIILGAIGTQPALAEPSASALAPRTEIHAIETITLSDQQLLTGDKNGQRITIAGQKFRKRPE